MLYENNWLKYSGIGVVILAFIDLATALITILGAAATEEAAIVVGNVSMTPGEMERLMLVDIVLACINFGLGLKGIGAAKTAERSARCLMPGGVLAVVYLVTVVLTITAGLRLGWVAMVLYPVCIALYLVGAYLGLREWRADQKRERAKERGTLPDWM